jgi:hypothetical protein
VALEPDNSHSPGAAGGQHTGLQCRFNRILHKKVLPEKRADSSPLGGDFRAGCGPHRRIALSMLLVSYQEYEISAEIAP